MTDTDTDTDTDMNMGTDMKIIDIEPGDDRTEAMLPVLCELRPHLTPELFRGVYEEGYGQGLRFMAAFREADDRACLGVAGWRVMANTSGLRQLYVDDLVVTATVRSTGVGAALLGRLRERARELGCRRLVLDSGTRRTRAHRFYLREGMHISGFHLHLPLTAD